MRIRLSRQHEFWYGVFFTCIGVLLGNYIIYRNFTEDCSSVYTSVCNTFSPPAIPPTELAQSILDKLDNAEWELDGKKDSKLVTRDMYIYMPQVLPVGYEYEHNYIHVGFLREPNDLDITHLLTSNDKKLIHTKAKLHRQRLIDERVRQHINKIKELPDKVND